MRCSRTVLTRARSRAGRTRAGGSVARASRTGRQHWEADPRRRQRSGRRSTLRVNVRANVARAALVERLAAIGMRRAPVGASAGIVVDVRGRCTSCRASPRAPSRCRTLGAQLAPPLLEVADGQRVLDACAAPGGKTTHLLELADVELTALDSDESRLARIRENLARLRLDAATARDRRTATPARRDAGGTAVRSTASWPTCPARRRASCAGTRTASGCGARRDVAGFRRRSRTRILDALWPLLAPRRPPAVRDLLGVPRGKRAQIDALPGADARRVARNHQLSGTMSPHAGGQLLPSPERREPQSGRLLLRAAPQVREIAPPPAAGLTLAGALRPPACCPTFHRAPGRSRTRVRASARCSLPRCSPCAAPPRGRGFGAAQRGRVARRGRARCCSTPTSTSRSTRRSRRRCRTASRCTSCSSSSCSGRAGTGSTRRWRSTRRTYARVVQRAHAAIPRAQRPAVADVQLARGGRALIGRVTSRPVAQRERAREGHALRRGDPAAARREPAAEAVPGQCARVARVDARVGLAPLHVHAVSPAHGPRGAALAAARLVEPVGDRAVPARHRDREHRPVRAGLRQPARPQRRARRRC